MGLVQSQTRGSFPELHVAGLSELQQLSFGCHSFELAFEKSGVGDSEVGVEDRLAGLAGEEESFAELEGGPGLLFFQLFGELLGSEYFEGGDESDQFFLLFLGEVGLTDVVELGEDGCSKYNYTFHAIIYMTSIHAQRTPIFQENQLHSRSRQAA